MRQNGLPCGGPFSLYPEHAPLRLTVAHSDSILAMLRSFALRSALSLAVLLVCPQSFAQDLPDVPGAVDDPLFSNLAHEPTIKKGSGKWEGSLGLGFTARRGSENSTEGSISLDALREMRDSRLLANVVAVRSAEDGERSGDNAQADFRGERRISKQMFGFAGLGSERDAYQDMTLRGSFSSGVGLRWVETEATQFNLHTGLAYSVERYRAGRSEKGLELLLGSELRHQLSKTSRITHRLVLYPDSVGGGLRMAMQADLTTRINSHFGLQLAVLQKYRERARETSSNLDTVFFTGITAGF